MVIMRLNGYRNTLVQQDRIFFSSFPHNVDFFLKFGAHRAVPGGVTRPGKGQPGETQFETAPALGGRFQVRNIRIIAEGQHIRPQI